MPIPALEFYDARAEEYAKVTFAMDTASLRERFLKYVRPKGFILDAGCGSGRDALAFHQAGYFVDAFDGSPALTEQARLLTDLPVSCITYDQIDAFSCYDGVWACASLLHLEDRVLDAVINKLMASLHPGGVFYTCFKKGPGFRIAEDGRGFNDFELERLMALPSLQDLPVLDHWETGDAGGRGVTWTNVLVRKP